MAEKDEVPLPSPGKNATGLIWPIRDQKRVLGRRGMKLRSLPPVSARDSRDSTQELAPTSRTRS